MAVTKSKQYKNTYKIPRSLKESIKQNLNKIVKRRERQIRDEETLIDIEIRLAEVHSHCNALDNLIQDFDMSRELAHALDALLFSHWDNTNHAVELQKAELKGKKAFARHVMSNCYPTKKIKKDMTMWKGDGQGDDDDEDMELNDDDDEVRGSETVDEDDWSSTSTLA
ncbi:unnamed protein product [Aureobasidium mustum]|uniref:Uncharacterized protein n=1 Tax=Aureobasidium mustum TaxID=2773714 RepID=A0A9N8K489_9PEZI|nr:unnamed protein product [Aureobasidium mustum]